jgi:hypothetical protein
MRPARPNKTWAEDLPRSPFCYLSPRGCARLQTGEAPGHAKKGRLSLYSSTGANPLSAPHFQGLARWKVLIRWRRLPVGHLPCQLVLFFPPVPNYVDHQNVNSFTLCYGRTQLLLWKVGA